MKSKVKNKKLNSKPDFSNQRGAALLMTLLLSTLLLAAGGALIVSTSMSATTAVDSTAEMQAYTAAEAGMEAALNVLRGNVAPATSGAKINFLKAVTPATSNKVGDTSTESRLSGWLTYSTTYPDRVPISSNYSPQNGFAYKISITDPDNNPSGTAPNKLVIKSTGIGPKGATKILEMLVKVSSIDFEAPATITVRGADDGGAMTFNLGDSPLKVYSGNDLANPTAPNLPAFAVTNHDTRKAADSIAGGVLPTTPKLGILPIDTTINPTATAANAPPSSPVTPAPSNVSKVPAILQSADTARAFVSQMKAIAQSSNRYFTSWSGPSGTATAPVITFVEGNATINGGAGLVVVTGDCLFHENAGFTGLIMVLGNGSLRREGGGPSTFNGGLVVARFGATGGFLAPTYDTQADQGNLVTMQYDSSAINNALALTGLTVRGIIER
jgi:type II secretory pathway pseudopilin PulG